MSLSRRYRFLPVSAIAAVVALCAVVVPQASALMPTPLQVNKHQDTNDGACNDDCSLREAVVAANSDDDLDTILVPPGNYSLTRTGAGEDAAAFGDLDITKPVVIRGSGVANTFIKGLHSDRLFDVTAGGISVTIARMTLTGGDPGSNAGGAIQNVGMTTLRNLVIQNNTANTGGGIFNTGTLTISRTLVTGNTTVTGTSNPQGGGMYTGGGSTTTVLASTFSDNETSGSGQLSGGGIHAQGTTLVVRNSTIVGNTATFGGGISSTNSELTLNNDTIARNTAKNGQSGGIEHFSFDGTIHVSMGNTILAGNFGFTATANRNCHLTDNTLDSHGHNLESGTTCDLGATGDQSSTPAGLTPLGANGGPVPTMSLLTTSLARNHGGGDCEPKDERGVPRPQGSACDVGASESAVATVTKPLSPTVHLHTFPVAWKAPKPGAATFDVRFRRHAIGGSGGAFHPFKTDTSLRQAPFTAEFGFEYCFSARAIDKGGHLGVFGPERCAEVSH